MDATTSTTVPICLKNTFWRSDWLFSFTYDFFLFKDFCWNFPLRNGRNDIQITFYFRKKDKFENFCFFFLFFHPNFLFQSPLFFLTTMNHQVFKLLHNLRPHEWTCYSTCLFPSLQCLVAVRCQRWFILIGDLKQHSSIHVTVLLLFSWSFHENV